VPPPPVAGATVGVVGVVGAAAVAGAAVVGVGMVGVGVGGVVVPVSDVAGVLVVAVDVAVAGLEGDDVGRVIEVPPVVQAEITAEASMAKMPQPSAASLALSPVLAVVARPLMETPRKRRGP
jgi:hypothetical protein